MKRCPSRAGKAGYVSYLLVLSTGAILSLMMVHAHRKALTAHKVQSNIQLRLDYQEKEDTILRSIVAITPNRAIRAMQHNSNSSTTTRNPLRWQNIFTESLDLANARTSIPAPLISSLNIPNLRLANTGDSTLTNPANIFRAVNNETGFVSTGLNRNLGAAYPPALNTSNSTTSSRDLLYPIISDDKRHGALAEGRVGLPVTTYPDYNLLTYPQINFGYARPGDPFVAKRNWWAFSMDVAAHDASLTRLARPRRDFVLSIYEIPSQLAISASAFMALGEYASGEAWQNVTIDGGVFAGRALVQGDTALPALASRRGMSLSSGSTIGGRSFANNPFTPGVREAYQITEGEFFPVSLASESGRVAFIPINRGADFFDRFAHTTESSTLSPTTWNNYSVGALQCAMRLDITKVVSATNRMPTEVRFSYIRNGVRETYAEPLVTGIVADLPRGYVRVANENQIFTFNEVVDVAYGLNGRYFFQTDVTGPVAFNNARFGDPIVGTVKGGFFRPSPPYRVRMLPSGKICIAIYPQRFAAYLNLLGADSTAVNNSLVVNVDYTAATGSTNLVRPSIPCTELDYGLIIQESADLSSFTRGFSLVTNLRTFFGDDFNVVPTTPPAGYTPAGDYFPPVSMFMPEKRFGVEVDPFGVSLGGQLGSLASESAAVPVRPIDSVTVSGSALPANRIRVNLRPITHPAELPPITMKNWLVVLEEVRREFIGK